MEGLNSSSSGSSLPTHAGAIRHRGLSPKQIQGAFLSPLSAYSPLPQSFSKFLSDEDDDEGVQPSTRPPTEPPVQETLTVRVEDADDVTSRPTVLLVHRPSYSPAIPRIEPFDNRHSTYSQTAQSRNSLAPHADGAQTAVPLTPRPDLAERNPSNSSEATRASHISRLPSPDFSAPRSGNTIFDFFRGYATKPKHVRTKSHETNESDQTTSRSVPGQRSFRGILGVPLTSLRALRLPSFGNPAGASSTTYTGRSTSTDHRPTQLRNDSASSASSSSSAQTHASSGSVDSGRHSLLSVVSTTDKFTHKWPRPLPIRGLSAGSQQSGYSKVGVDGDIDTEVPESEVGLGMERVGRWTVHKWFLLLSVVSVFGYSTIALVYAILTWYQTWPLANVMLVADNDILVLITLCASLMLAAALVGTTGALLNSRPILALYALLLWPALLSLLSVGYLSYKRAVFALDRKLNLAWSEWYTPLGRLIVQDALTCCGFYDAVHEASFSARCVARTTLPGCKAPLLAFEYANLTTLWTTAFALLPLHLVNIVVALLCANHVTRRFGKGLMPKRYRLRAEDVRANAHSLLVHFAEGATRPPLARAGSSTSYIRGDKEYR